MTELFLKRAYEPWEEGDGFRVYIDRIWPRGISRAKFKFDLWDKDMAPSAELRRWFHEDPDARWNEFEKKYAEELRVNPALSQFNDIIADKPVVTLLYSSEDTERNNAAVLKNFIMEEVSSKDSDL